MRGAVAVAARILEGPDRRHPDRPHRDASRLWLHVEPGCNLEGIFTGTTGTSGTKYALRVKVSETLMTLL